MKSIKINNFEIANDKPFTLIAGPCVIESQDHALGLAEDIARICERAKINFIFKASFDKANRTNINSVRGIGLQEALPIFEAIKLNFHCPVLTDIHSESQCKEIAEFDMIDIIQIPAFLCRQTDLLVAAAKTGKIINAISYTDKWYNDDNKSEGGWSIERVNPNLYCEGKNNWQASKANANGGRASCSYGWLWGYFWGISD